MGGLVVIVTDTEDQLPLRGAQVVNTSAVLNLQHLQAEYNTIKITKIAMVGCLLARAGNEPSAKFSQLWIRLLQGASPG